MRASKKVASVLLRACVACGACVKSCPLGAISVYKGMHAVVDSAKCVGCGKCAAACPADVLSVSPREAVPC